MTSVKPQTLDLSGRDRVPVPDDLARWIEAPKGAWIGGEPFFPKSENKFATINPATGEELTTFAEADKGAVDLAISTARRAFDDGSWSGQTFEHRAGVLKKLAELILAHRGPLAILETLDTGKPIRESYEGDILRSATNFEFFASQNEAAVERVFESQGNRHVARREPLGVVALVTPWNLPLYLATWKIAPALLMGNSIVLKPSELTPLTASYFAELTSEAGLPPGVFNVVHGFGENSAGEFLVSHAGINAVSFTGETSTGKAIMRSASPNLTRVSFELGGKGALVVFADADWERAADEAVRAGFRNQGEICLACPRVYVEAPIYESFKKRYLAGVEALRMGDPLDPQTSLGSLISVEHRSKVQSYAELAARDGKVLTGNLTLHAAKDGTGFFSPLVVEDLPASSRVNREEIFGPVVSLNRFEKEEDVIAQVNDTPYGLSSSIWTKNHSRAERVATKLRIGLVWINCWFVRDLRVPFGGQKKSGIGREGGSHSLDFFSEWKSVCFFGEGQN